MKELISAQELSVGIGRMAAEITECYGDAPITVVGVLTGSVVALADLVRQLQMPVRIGFVEASSYRGGTEPGELKLKADVLLDIADRDVLLVDDIFDTGHTLAGVLRLIEDCGAQSVRSAVLLRKQGRQQVAIQPDFAAFDIPDEFVVGYGLDYQDLYRNLPYLAALEEEDLNPTAPADPPPGT